MGIVTTLVLGGIAAAATVKSMVDQRKAAKQQERANKQAQRQEAYRSQRERLQAVRQQRIANASAINAGANSGMTSGSSMIAGGISAFNSQTASNMQFTNQMDAMTMERMRTLASADKLLNRANMFGQVATLAGQGFSASGGMKTVASALKAKGATT